MDILELIHIVTQQNQAKPHKCTTANCSKAFSKIYYLVSINF